MCAEVFSKRNKQRIKFLKTRACTCSLVQTCFKPEGLTCLFLIYYTTSLISCAETKPWLQIAVPQNINSLTMLIVLLVQRDRTGAPVTILKNA